MALPLTPSARKALHARGEAALHAHGGERPEGGAGRAARGEAALHPGVLGVAVGPQVAATAAPGGGLTVTIIQYALPAFAPGFYTPREATSTW